MNDRPLSYRERNPISVYYETQFEDGFTSIIATSELYWNCKKRLDDGNGLHYDAITIAMINVGAYEVKESIYEIDDGDIARVIQEMKDQGFLLAKCEEFSAMVSDSVPSSKQEEGKKRMNKSKKCALTPVSMGVYRQWVFDCAARLMESDCTKEEIADRLIFLSDFPTREDGDAAGRGKQK